jgi:hypothetical protein
MFHRFVELLGERGHPAEVEAELGEIDAAIARLYPLAIWSDDTDYVGQLARLLGDVGCTDESWRWRQFASAHYNELVVARPGAFADHATKFWVAVGADPMKAIRLAPMNFEVRQTPRVRDMLGQAVAAAQSRGML